MAALLCAVGTAQAESIDGKTYTNFGDDLPAPVFPVNGQLHIYQNKMDSKPKEIVSKPVTFLEGDWKACAKSAPDDWAYCNVYGTKGWVKRSEFRSGGDVAPVSSWPFRYWLYVAGSGMGGEGTDNLIKVARTSPYLIAPAEYDNIFFHVRFDEEGRAISPKTGKLTGDRIFLFGTAVYLAPDDAQQRSGATWLYLGHYHEKLQALCPSPNPDSCMSAVNLNPNWPGIKAFYAEVPARYRQKEGDSERWAGPGEVAFARHSDPVTPFMYRVPNSVHMRIDGNSLTDAQRDKNRQKLFCIADCGKR